MSKELETKIGSTIYTRITTIQMTPAQRQKALNALYEADLLVDGLIWVAKKIEQLGDRLFLKPSLKQPSLKH
jgi:hypothetical protein